MFSLVAIFLLVPLVAGGAAFFVVRYAKRGWTGGLFADAHPALVTLFWVFAAYLVGWVLAVALASP